MPIYEYACQACGHDFEAIQKFSDAPLSECPVCGQPQLKKLISAGGFHLKGSGWYATDFKGGPKKSDSSGGSDSGSGSGPGSSACGNKAGGCGGGCAG
jgi:putative FmdB family regulatory protein